MRWSIVSSQYEVHYLPPTTIKGQAMANFIVELTPSEESETLPIASPTTVKPLMMSHLALIWEIYVNGSLNDQGCGADLILTLSEPECLRIEYVL